MSTMTLMTVEQFVGLPDEEHDRHELVEGKLIPTASLTPKNSWIRDDLRGGLSEYLRRTDWGVAIEEVDCKTIDRTVRRPDIAVFAINRWNAIDLHHVPVPFSPDIAIEVVSLSDKFIELEAKVREYLKSGSKEVWLVDGLNREIHIRTQAGIRLLYPDNRLETELLPGFSVLVEDVLSPQ